MLVPLWVITHREFMPSIQNGFQPNFRSKKQRSFEFNHFQNNSSMFNVQKAKLNMRTTLRKKACSRSYRPGKSSFWPMANIQKPSQNVSRDGTHVDMQLHCSVLKEYMMTGWCAAERCQLNGSFGTLERTHQRFVAVVKGQIAGGKTRRRRPFYSVYSRIDRCRRNQSG
jgi:hypothetical protein